MAIILVIDDDRRTRRLIGRMLAKGKHETIEARNGAEGVKLLQARQPAVVITDIFMPEMEGIETIREIRRLSPGTKIIAMSGGGGGPQIASNFLDAAKKLGADVTIEKPFRTADILKLIEGLLRQAE